MKKKLIVLVLMLLVFSVSKTLAQSITIPKFDLSKEDKLISSTFISLQGQDRVAEFKKLLPLFKQETVNLSRPISTLDDVLEYLGPPDTILTGNFYQYNLKAGTDPCKAIVKVDKLGQIVFAIIKDCL
jgi:hypothetical protein